ncbi:p26 [Cucurbit yellow stunting disorder virus]|uniref:p26 n=1 Tax=Cucurbit yellow stunting disorder virus TaxID=51330 RepID=Q808I2_9CLOS|nr:p26 [Cucurbit yellow stunting disorder virus]AAP33617.1 p26 [Cucurbit yellow stunting disorder virus]ACL13306.1 p26 [Cucurbit yellow stunting disorder virus]QTH19339.1 p26 protein [Cucurbit yellow stunting disorder virus]QTH19347.1 P26 protein [Cucurbit yellow stunting disorder virus]WFP36082.1 MAG: p26 [Cucurbit yellow stunting disorder virus]
MEFPTNDIEHIQEDGEDFPAIISKNLNSVLNAIQNHSLYDMIMLDNAIETCYTLIIMCQKLYEDVNLYSATNPRTESFRNASVNVNTILNNKDKLFPKLSSWQIDDLVKQLIPILNFLKDSKTKIMNDLRVNNLFSVYRINDVRSLLTSLQTFLTSYYNFGRNTVPEFSLYIDDSEKLEKLIKGYKSKRYLTKSVRNELVNYFSNNLVYQISFLFDNIGINIKPIKNF